MNQSDLPLWRPVSRRTALKLTGTSAASAVLTSALGSCMTRDAQVQAFQQNSTIAQVPPTSNLITKEIPQTKERVPAIGLGTFMAFDVIPISNEAA